MSVFPSKNGGYVKYFFYFPPPLLFPLSLPLSLYFYRRAYVRAPFFCRPIDLDDMTGDCENHYIGGVPLLALLLLSCQ